LVYLFNAANTNPVKITEKLKKISIMGAQIAKTTAEQLEERGLLRGIEEGLKQVAIKMIKDGVDNVSIVKYTDLSISQIELLRKSENFK